MNTASWPRWRRGACVPSNGHGQRLRHEAEPARESKPHLGHAASYRFRIGDHDVDHRHNDPSRSRQQEEKSPADEEELLWRSHAKYLVVARLASEAL